MCVQVNKESKHTAQLRGAPETGEPGVHSYSQEEARVDSFIGGPFASQGQFSCKPQDGCSNPPGSEGFPGPENSPGKDKKCSRDGNYTTKGTFEVSDLHGDWEKGAKKGGNGARKEWPPTTASVAQYAWLLSSPPL